MLYLIYVEREIKAGYGSCFGQLSMCERDTLLMLYHTAHFLAVWAIEVLDYRDSD